MLRLLLSFGLIFLTACEADVIPVDDGSAPANQLVDTGTVPGEDTAAPADEPAGDNTGYTDQDGDGRTSQIDCDDQNAEVYPDALDDTCDGIDQDCDGVDGNDASTTAPPPSGQSECGGVDEDGDGYLTINGRGDTVDCDDTDASVHPGASETDNGIDDDCDGMIDEGTDTGPTPNDADGDGYASDEDCDDTDATIYPGAAEVVGDGVDQDCDGTDLIDQDCDGYTDAVDCDDTDAWVHPGASETCDEQDNDCDGSVDEGVTTRVYEDDDGDGWGDEFSGEDVCSVESGFTTVIGDCDDSSATVYPGATESDNGIDDDCDGEIDEGFGTEPTDADGDGYDSDEDCDDTDASINPGAAEDPDELDDGLDNDCDGSIDEFDGTVQADVLAVYPVSGSYTLNTALYSDGSDPSARSWEDESVTVSEDYAHVEYLESEYGDIGGFCGLIINGDGYGLDDLCWGGERDTTIEFDIYWQGSRYDESDLEVWIANASTGSCALILQVSTSSSCDPVDDT